MKILALADSHIGAGLEHRKDALADTAAVLDQVVELAIERGCSLVLHGGDVFHRTKPSPAELHVFKRFCGQLQTAGIPLVVIHGNGNHEAAGDDRSAVELFADGWVTCSRRPEVILLPEVAICTLPAVPLGRLVATSTTDRAEISKQAVSLLLQSARDLYASAPTDRPRILLGHWSVSGASLPTGLPVDQLGELVLPLEALEEIGYDAIILGHIHKAQFLGSLAPEDELMPIFYCGSPMTMDFGEQYDLHGCHLIEFGNGYPLVNFVPLADRRFVTIDHDLTDEVEAFHLGATDETDAIASSIAAEFPLTDAVVRVRYRASEEQHRRVDQPALLRLLDDAGIHRLYGGLAWEPVRENRTRAAGVDETLAPLDAVGLWLEAQSMNGAEGDALKTLTAAYLETLA